MKELDLPEVLASMQGSSPLADALIQRRFGEDFEATAAASATKNGDYDDILDDVIKHDYDGKGEAAVRQLSTVVLRLVDELAIAQAELSSLRKGDMATELDEEQVAAEVAMFKTHLDGNRVSDLRKHYAEEFFRPLTVRTRCMLATALVEYADHKNNAPSDLWTVIISTSGSLGE